MNLALHPRPAGKPAVAFAWPGLLLAALLAVAVVVLSGCGANPAAGTEPAEAVDLLRAAVASAEPGAWNDEMEIVVGRPAFALARLGARFAPVDPRVHDAFRVGRGAAVRIAHRAAGDAVAVPAGALLEEARRRMSGAGWERAVAVVDGGELVNVFVPAGAAAGDELTCAVLVCDREQLVVVAARLNPEALQRLVEAARPPGHGGTVAMVLDKLRTTR
jgi:hypothetical protein